MGKEAELARRMLQTRVEPSAGDPRQRERPRQQTMENVPNMCDERDQQARIERLEAELNRIRRVHGQTARITNDLNNLLAVMKGQAQLACNDPTGQEKEELVRVVLSSTLSAEAVMNRVCSRPTRSGARSINETGPPLPPDREDAVAFILVADDEEPMRRLLAHVLGKSGHHVMLASSGAEAVRIGCREHFDLAFIDIQLGDMNGAQVCEAIRRKQPGTQIVFVSGDPDLEHIASVHDRNPAAFIRKPFDIEEIRQRVSYFMSMRTALQEI